MMSKIIRRVECFLLWFVDGARRLDCSDDRWEFFLLFVCHCWIKSIEEALILFNF